jgi:hypothetical protein
MRHFVVDVDMASEWAKGENQREKGAGVKREEAKV